MDRLEERLLDRLLTRLATGAQTASTNADAVIESGSAPDPPTRQSRRPAPPADMSSTTPMKRARTEGEMRPKAHGSETVGNMGGMASDVRKQPSSLHNSRWHDYVQRLLKQGATATEDAPPSHVLPVQQMNEKGRDEPHPMQVVAAQKGWEGPSTIPGKGKGGNWCRKGPMTADAVPQGEAEDIGHFSYTPSPHLSYGPMAQWYSKDAPPMGTFMHKGVTFGKTGHKSSWFFPLDQSRQMVESSRVLEGPYMDTYDPTVFGDILPSLGRIQNSSDGESRTLPMVAPVFR